MTYEHNNISKKDTVEPPVSDHSKINVKPIWSLTDVVSYESLGHLGTKF